MEHLENAKKYKEEYKNYPPQLTCFYLVFVCVCACIFYMHICTHNKHNGTLRFLLLVILFHLELYFKHLAISFYIFGNLSLMGI